MSTNKQLEHKQGAGFVWPWVGRIRPLCIVLPLHRQQSEQSLDKLLAVVKGCGKRLTCVLQGILKGSSRQAAQRRHSHAAAIVPTAHSASGKAAEQAGGEFCPLQQARLGILLREGPLRLILAGGGI